MTTAKTTPIRILIVDDHGLVREGLKRLLDEESDIEVVGEASNASQALRLLAADKVDVAVVDINLPDKTGLDLLETIKRDWPNINVLIVSAAPEEHYAVRAIRLGASGYLSKDGALELLVPAIRALAVGGKYITQKVAELLANQVRGGSAAEGTFTDRELEVLKLIAQGKSTSQIAEVLHLSDKTVGTYRIRIQDKVGVKSNAELTRYALEHRILG
jgi:DNA-binding NarL/FixJ family response regulator